MRLPFVLHDFTRIIWHSEAARAVWQPRIAQITQVWSQVEQEAVAQNLREACLTFVQPQALPTFCAGAVKRGLAVLPLAAQGQTAQYSSTPVAFDARKPWQYRVVLTRADRLARWVDVWHTTPLDNQAVGAMLGYPHCCRKFFERVWIEDQCVDTTWAMACQGDGSDEPSMVAVGAGTPPEANILLRWLGVRLVPHLPCSFTCTETVEDGKEFAWLGRQIDEQAIDWLYEMLAWPVEWSALHGIAEVRTPVLAVSTRTDATAEKLVVQKAGSGYPEDGANGLRFPFRIVTGKVTSKPSFQRSVTPIHTLNGFGSAEAMERAHEVVLGALKARGPGDLLDLGCGTGRLLERAKALGWRVRGIESDAVRASAAQLPVTRGDLFDVALWSEPQDVVAFMPGRLLEDVSRERADTVRARLRAWPAVLAYAYGEWLEKYGALAPLLAEAGLGDGEVVSISVGHGVQAVLLQFGAGIPATVGPDW